MNKRVKTKALIGLLGFFVCCLPVSRADDSSAIANKIKSGYLFNFAKFVEWPKECFPEKESPMIVGVLGKDPISSDIQSTLNGKLIDGHRLEVRQIAEGEEGQTCHLLFVCASEKKRLIKILESQKSRHVLTVSDMEYFIDEGGIIGLRRDGVNIRFEINQKEAERAGLKISSKLLQLAKPGK